MATELKYLRITCAVAAGNGRAVLWGADGLAGGSLVRGSIGSSLPKGTRSASRFRPGQRSIGEVVEDVAIGPLEFAGVWKSFVTLTLFD